MRKLPFEFVYNFFKSKGCKLRTKEYIDARTPMAYICVCGNESTISFSHFKDGHRCMKCSGNKKHTIEEAQAYFKSKGCKLLATEYIDTNTPMAYICVCGNESTISFSNFKNGHRCAKCGRNKKHTIEEAQAYFNDHGYKLIATKYINNSTPMAYICSKCGNESKISFSAFKKGHRCAKCGGNKKYDIDFVRSYFELHSCHLLEKYYCNVFVPMRYICICGNEATTTFSNFLKGKRCKKCGINKSRQNSGKTRAFLRKAWNECEFSTDLHTLISERLGKFETKTSQRKKRPAFSGT